MKSRVWLVNWPKSEGFVKPAVSISRNYGLTKNEGGNFVLSSKNKDWIKMNIVVMCRSCNSAKAQAHYLTFFGSEVRQKVAESHKRILTTLLEDSEFQKILKRWNK